MRRHQSERAGVGKILLYMAVLGVLMAWATILCRPAFLKLGLTEAAADRLPGFSFFGGLALGLAMGFSRSVKETLLGVGGAFLLGGVLWFFGVFAGGMLLGMGVSERVVEWIPTVAFAAGLLLGLFPLVILAKEAIWRPADRK